MCVYAWCGFFFFEEKTAYEISAWLEFRRVLFRSLNANVGSITVKVTATDESSVTISDTFTITIANTNDTPTVANAIADQSVDEDSAFIFTVPADTFNDKDGDTLPYTATLSDGSALPSWLSFDASTQTFSGTPLNDDVGSINIQVTATDAAGVTISDTFAIAVANTNDDPTAIALSSLGVPEKIDGAVVGTLTTTDVDVGDNHNYTVSDDRFEVVGGLLKLKTGNTIDYTNEQSITLTVTTTDAAGDAFDQSFSISVNTAPTSIALTNSLIDESHKGLTIGDLSVSDPNAGDTFTYSITGGADQNYFEITASGELKLKSTKYADYEVDDALTVTITATDQGGLSTQKTFTISVNDLDHATPDASDIRPVSIPLSGNTIIDNLLWGFTLDYDRDPTTPLTITYSLIGIN